MTPRECFVCDVAAGVALGLFAYQTIIWAVRSVVLPVLRAIGTAIKQLFSFTFRIR